MSCLVVAYAQEVTPGSGKWTEAQARTFCQAYLDGSNIVRLCKFQADVTVVHYVNICIQDILVSPPWCFTTSFYILPDRLTGPAPSIYYTVWLCVCMFILIGR